MPANITYHCNTGLISRQMRLDFFSPASLRLTWMYMDGIMNVEHLLMQVPARSPLALASIKGFTGHQEAASGIANLLAAALTASTAQIPAAVNLRTLNPLVAGALAGQPSRIARGGPAGMPAPTAGSTGSMQMGVNAFGAQGTNAHVVLAAGAASVVAQSPAAGVVGALQKRRCWIMPPMQVGVITNVLPAEGLCVACI